MEKPKIYLETTIPSYLVARASRDLLIAAHQQVTRAWWDDHRGNYDLFVSEFVIAEIAFGEGTMNHDPIVEEVHRARERLAASCDYDLDRIFDEIQRRQKAESAPVVSFAKPSQPVSAASGVHSDNTARGLN